MVEQKNLKPLDENWERALAVVAHPDDLEYGAASAVARWTSQGKQVNYLMVTRGEAGIDSMPPEETGPLREEEERISAGLVGVKTVCISGSPQADHAVDVTDFLDKGIASLKAHKAYIQNLTGDFDPEAFLRNNASATGKRFGCQYAVGFEVMKI